MLHFCQSGLTASGDRNRPLYTQSDGANASNLVTNCFVIVQCQQADLGNVCYCCAHNVACRKSKQFDASGLEISIKNPGFWVMLR